MVLVGVQSVRESSRKAQCQNNLRQTILAAIQVIDRDKKIPSKMSILMERESGPGGRGPDVGGPFVLIAMQMSIPCKNIRGTIRVNSNRTGESLPPPVFTCPSNGDSQLAFRMNQGVEREWEITNRNDRILFKRGYNKGQSISAVTDGLSNTIAFAERPSFNETKTIRRSIARDSSAQSFEEMPGFCESAFRSGMVFSSALQNYPEWWSSRNCDTEYDHSRGPNFQAVDCISTFGPMPPVQRTLIASRSFHVGGVNVAALDGSIRLVSDRVAIETWRALGTHDMGDVVDDW